MRLITDTIEFCAKEVPRVNPIPIPGYHIREAGATALQELASHCVTASSACSTLSTRGWMWMTLLPALAFSFSAHNDFFEEIAKYPASRRIW